MQLRYPNVDVKKILNKRSSSDSDVNEKETQREEVEGEQGEEEQEIQAAESSEDEEEVTDSDQSDEEKMLFGSSDSEELNTSEECNMDIDDPDLD